MRRREVRKKGFILSFGDIMLPFVGVVAIGLLVVAGKLFFVDGFQTGREPAPIQPELRPLEEQPAPQTPSASLLPSAAEASENNDAEKAEKLSVSVVGVPASPSVSAPPRVEKVEQPVPGMLPVPQSKPLRPLDLQAIPYEDKGGQPRRGQEKPKASKVDVVVTPAPETPPKASQPEKKTPPSNSNTQNTQAKKVVVVKPSAPKPVPRAEPKKAPAAAPAQPKTSSWRVQVGAFSSKQAADDTIRDLSKAGFSASVNSGPKFHKVWVQAGNSQVDASSMISRLAKAGYPGGFAIPPSR